MSYFNNTGNYVKFIKGSQNAFNNLVNSGKVDDNTLYFITDGSELKLYLGSTLISSTEPKDEVLSLNGLSDVELGTVIGANSILSYHSEKGQWVETSLTELAAHLNVLTEEAVKGIVNEAVGSLVDGAPDTLNTLKEIAEWISTNEPGAVALVTRVGTLEGLVQENKTAVSNLQTTVGTLGGKVNTAEQDIIDLKASVGTLEDLLKDSESGKPVDLNNYVTKTTFETTVGSLSDLKTEKTGSLVEAINELNDRLIWGEIPE